MSATLRALVVDDEQPARAELAYLLRRDERVGEITVAGSAAQALRGLREDPVDTVFLDIAMPGLDGLELAAVLQQFREPPRVVFVTAHTEHAVEAFELAAVDYLLKPVREERLREAVRRALEARDTGGDTGGEVSGGAVSGQLGGGDTDETIPVELGGVTRFVQRSQVRYVEAHGDYARLHTASDSHLVRLPLTSLEQRWAAHGFLRIHRSVLVARSYIEQVRVEDGRASVVVGGVLLPVSRRHTAQVREALRMQLPEPL
ncbi:MAG: LytTR family DNA-binding domain-containing protein [Actinomycetota bacterium]|nr:LytTR family DNA-binding domain-containing protein [Actinomycetota bacterium]